MSARGKAVAGVPVALGQYVHRLLVGTPLLLRTVNAAGQEELQICTFSISEDMKLLRWQDSEDSGQIHDEVPLSAISHIHDDSSVEPGGADDEDGHHALSLTLKHGERDLKLYLICASPEDLTAWRDGLGFLTGRLPSAPKAAGAAADGSRQCAPRVKAVPLTPSASSVAGLVGPGARHQPSAKASPKASPKASGTGTAADGSADSVESLQQQLQRERESNAALSRENQELTAMLRRKDDTIAGLVGDLQSRGDGKCSKTESTSRESDVHLRDREVAVLSRKNRRLRKALQAKQQTIAELLKLVGKVSAQQEAESSAVEDVDDDDDNDSDAQAGEEHGASSGVQESLLQASANAASSAAAVSAPKSALRASAPGAVSARAPAPAVDAGAQAADGDGMGAQMLETLLGQLTGLGREVPGMSAAFRPPPRPAGGPAPGSAPPGDRPALLPPQPRAHEEVAAPLEPPVRGAEGPSAGSKAGAPAGPVACGSGSAAALQALERELSLLEAKKRAVERLARDLEPPSEGEEEDGFPLR